ncbi:MAG: hypothetical protein CLLPBCKN_008597 [Chroococcidiopsis cubana SAG 39.79]|nr:hypothetical protein [Chroococcidiopsis cubana SAG 39.79]
MLCLPQAKEDPQPNSTESEANSLNSLNSSNSLPTESNSLSDKNYKSLFPAARQKNSINQTYQSTHLASWMLPPLSHQSSYTSNLPHCKGRESFGECVDRRLPSPEPAKFIQPVCTTDPIIIQRRLGIALIGSQGGSKQ